MTYRHTAQFKLRLPADVKVFLAAEAEKNASSQSSEIVRAIRERMARETKTAPDRVGARSEASPGA